MFQCSGCAATEAGTPLAPLSGHEIAGRVVRDGRREGLEQDCQPGFKATTYHGPAQKAGGNTHGGHSCHIVVDMVSLPKAA